MDLLALAGFDFVVLDSEHGFFHIESLENMIRASEAANLPAVVRVPSCAAAEVGRCLDAGAAGTLFPRADGCATARAAIESAKFAPGGKRGLGGARVNRYGTLPLDRFVHEANENTLVAIQIETSGALRELEGIASLPGLDVLFVGPNDLTQALGIPGQYNESRYQVAVRDIAQAATAAGKAAGIMLGRADQIPGLAKLGYRFFTTSDRTLVLESARAWRSSLAP